jgi:Ulp1 family protease
MFLFLFIFFQQVFFPVLQAYESEYNSHWFLLVLNLRAQRFEVMDSIRDATNQDLLTISKNIMHNIKALWKEHHGNSKLDISPYELLYVDASKQSTV